MHASAQATSHLPRGMLGKIDKRVDFAQVETVNGGLRKLSGARSVEKEVCVGGEGGEYDSSSSSSSSFSHSASGFDQAYSGNVAQGTAITPTRRAGGHTEGCFCKAFLPPGAFCHADLPQGVEQQLNDWFGEVSSNMHKI